MGENTKVLNFVSFTDSNHFSISAIFPENSISPDFLQYTYSMVDIGRLRILPILFVLGFSFQTRYIEQVPCRPFGMPL